jgi:predicted HTH transcriptional regulator
MRILLAHNKLYYPSHGGGDKSNRLLLEALAQRGHECRVVARLGSMAPGEIWQALGVSRQGAMDLLRPLLAAGLVEKVGGKKLGRYGLRKR